MAITLEKVDLETPVVVNNEVVGYGEDPKTAFTKINNNADAIEDALDGLSADYEPIIDVGTTAQYWRGDKTWQTLDKTAVGLGSLDNTADKDKPVSNATQKALDDKADKTAISNVDNTSDADKPVSTATQTALDLKLDISDINKKKWYSQPIGIPIALSSYDLPPTNDNLCVWVELGATSTYSSNAANITSISTTGTAPLILSTAVVSNSASSLNGVTISLINDEGRYLISGTSGGTLRNDAMQKITGTLAGVYSNSATTTGALSVTSSSTTAYYTTSGGTNDRYRVISLDSSLVTRTDTTTHGRDISARFFMRIV